jgi:Na+-translocating ferredoxin:NAD+ oxidoreductase subunit D
MSLITVTSPHTTRSGNHTGAFMRQVIYATVPGVVTLTWLFGWGTLFNLAVAIPVAVAAEATMRKLRGYDVGFALRDWSAVLTAVLLALAIPPTAPWWLIVIGVLAAIVLAKQLYGGLGMNPFNPAMVGYVVLLISFPLEMTRWIGPHEAPSWFDSLRMTLASANADAFTGATPLDSFRTWAGNPEQLSAQPILHGQFAGLGWEWVNVAFLLGGIYLLARRIISWHIPVAMLAALALIALPFWLYDSSRYASPLFHLFSGAAMFGAFFIATDPVSAATSRYGRLIFAALIGVLVWVIRSYGGYPDAVAFAVLLMNLAAPTIDYYTQPRTYGHHKAKRGVVQ